MAIADLNRTGVQPDEQIALYDPASWNPEALRGKEDKISRYNPGGFTTGDGVFPEIVDSPSGARMLRCTTAASTADRSQAKYTLHTEKDAVDMEVVWEFKSDPTNTAGRCRTFTLVDSEGKSVFFRFKADKQGDPGKGWITRARQVAGFTGDDWDEPGPDAAGGVNTMRIRFTAASDPGNTDDGTLEVYVLPGEDMVDREITGIGSEAWALASSVNHTLGALKEIFPRWDNNDAAIRGTASDNGVYYRYIALYTDESPPCDIDSDSCAWHTLQHYGVEMQSCWWNATNEKWDASFSVRYPFDMLKHLQEATPDPRVRMRFWTDHATYLAERSVGPNGVNNDGNFEIPSDDGDGYYRVVMKRTGSNGLEPDTAYWYDLQWRTGGNFYKSDDTDAEVNGAIRTPPAPGGDGATVKHRVSSCLNTLRSGPNELWYDGRSFSVGANGGANAVIRWFEGDWGYADEHLGFARDGVEKTGAQTVAQWKSMWFAPLHTLYNFRCAQRTWFQYVGDDHDRTTNDAGLQELREEDFSDWDRDRDGTTDGAITPDDWEHRGVGASNPLYGFPNAIRPNETTQYNITPRAFAANAMQAAREVWHPIMEPSGTLASGARRYDPSGVDLYGANQGGSSAKLDSDDGQFRYTDIGRTRFIMLDTRLFMDRSSNATFLGPAKQWVKDVIAATTLPGIVFVVPGYVQGAGDGSTLKRNDNYANFNSFQVDLGPERTEIFTTAVDANADLKWWGVIVGDHHFVSVDTTVSGLSSKGVFQIGSGGTQGIRQDFEDLNDTDGYLFLSDGGDGVTPVSTVRTLVEFEIVNAETGQINTNLYRVADPTTSDSGDGLDTLATLTLPGLGGLRSRDRGRER